MTWFQSSKVTAGGAANTPADLVAAVNTAFTTFQANPSFGWEIGTYNSGASPYITLKRKDGSPGRIMFAGGVTNSSTSSGGVGETGTASSAAVGYDPTATTDTPTNPLYGSSTSPPWGGSNRYAFTGFTVLPTGMSAGHWWYGYTHTNGALCLHVHNGNLGSTSSNTAIIMVGKFLKNESGTMVEGFAVNGHNQTGIHKFGEMLGTTNSQSAPSGNNILSGRVFAKDTVTGYWVRLARMVNDDFVYMNTNFTNSAAVWTKPDGTVKFAPCPFIIASGGLPATQSSILYTSNYCGYGMPGRVYEHTHVDNGGTTRGYYLGTVSTINICQSGFSLLNDSF